MKRVKRKITIWMDKPEVLAKNIEDGFFKYGKGWNKSKSVDCRHEVTIVFDAPEPKIEVTPSMIERAFEKSQDRVECQPYDLIKELFGDKA